HRAGIITPAGQARGGDKRAKDQKECPQDQPCTGLWTHAPPGRFDCLRLFSHLFLVGVWGRAKPAPRADFSGCRAGGLAASTTTRKGIRKSCALPYYPTEPP